MIGFFRSLCKSKSSSTSKQVKFCKRLNSEKAFFIGIPNSPISIFMELCLLTIFQVSAIISFHIACIGLKSLNMALVDICETYCFNGRMFRFMTVIAFIPSKMSELSTLSKSCCGKKSKLSDCVLSINSLHCFSIRWWGTCMSKQLLPVCTGYGDQHTPFRLESITDDSL